VSTAISTILSLDLGQQNDYSVLAITNIIRSGSSNITYEIPYIKKYLIRSSYVFIVKDVAEILKDKRLKHCDLIIDYTGVGHPVADLFVSNGISPICANITSGLRVSWPSPRTVNVPKVNLVSALQVVFQNMALKISSGIKIIDDVEKEFISFRAKMSKSGHSKFEAHGGTHDDIVMSIALGIWYGKYLTSNSIKCISGN
jgi:hypothetical protein